MKVARLRFHPKTANNGLQVLSCRFARKLIYRLSLNYFELQKESLHCHQLEEELDDWCQYWYFHNGTGLSCRSPDSWCKRFNVDNASLKSERFLNGLDLPELLREIHQFFLYRKYSACVIWWEKSFSASSSIWIQTSSVRSCSSWDARKSGSFKKRPWVPWKTPLDASLFQIMGNMIFSLFLSFPISVAMRSSLLNHMVRNWEKVQCILNDASVGCSFFQEMPTSAIDDALIPIQ